MNDLTTQRMFRGARVNYSLCALVSPCFFRIWSVVFYLALVEGDTNGLRGVVIPDLTRKKMYGGVFGR